ncbi:ketoacyl-synthetase C-terminal extension domain-containing protein, partial [Streptomyces sp. SID5910]|uniref:ketoacyl-synthetase C-terminal extension domain-containing protein n=1 Tax=Streptomyces sp. SID5910 TaxID=2690312 RepID=UPI0013ACA066
GVLPRTLHVDEPSPQVEWSAGAVELLTQSVEWPEAAEPRRAGVSSFGISGTNAHVILEEAPAVEAEPAADAEPPVVVPVAPWVVSGRSEAALRAQAERMAAFLSDASDADPVDVAWSLVSARSVFEHRAVVLSGDRAGLSAVVSGEPVAGVVRGEVVPGRLAVLFSG